MAEAAETLRRLELAIEGMSCSACVARLENAFRSTSQVHEAFVNLPTEVATVVVDESALTIDDLVGIVKRTGFDVGVSSEIIPIEGMSCAACVSRVENALVATEGVLGANVNLALEKATVSYLKRVTQREDLVAAVDNAGYQVSEGHVDSDRQGETEQASAERRLLAIAWVLTIPYLIQMFAQFAGETWIHMMPAVEAVFASILMVLVGSRFLSSALAAIRNRSANMDVLVSLGTTAAYLYSWYLMIKLGEAAEGEMYFEATAIILTLVLTGKFLEKRAKRATTSAIRELIALRPSTVSVIMDDGSVVDRPIEQLRSGDRFKVLSGDVIAADGIVLQGLASVNESLVTGESVPQTKQIGDMVVEGTINSDGYLEIETTTVGTESTLHRIVRMVESAQSGKTGIQRLVDRISAIFVPIVLAIACIVFLSWFAFTMNIEAALLNAVAVLLIACPCALGLATPSAITTGVGVAARRGILFKDLSSLENLHRVDTVILDKTGTLTQDTATLTAIEPNDEVDSLQLVRIAASLQAKSRHPIAKAFLAYADENRIDLLDVSAFKSHVGQGVEGVLANKRYRIGLSEFVGHKQNESLGRETIFLADEEKLLGTFTLLETIHSSASEAVRQLKDASLGTCLLSGDDDTRTGSVARTLDIDHYAGQLRPEDKVSKVHEYREKGNVIAMAGDGINDAPALAAADVSMAMASGTDVAIEVSSITLMHSDPLLIPAAFDIGRATFRKIKQNLFWAFIYNVLMIPLAASGMLRPELAGLAMSLSSVCVLLNSLLLKSWKSTKPEG